MASVHVFRSIEGGRAFSATVRTGAYGIYEVRHDGKLAHHSWMEWTTATSVDENGDLEAQLAQMRVDADAYWRGVMPVDAKYDETLLKPQALLQDLVERL